MGGVTGKRDETRGVLPRVPSLFLLRATPLPPLRDTSRNHVSRRRFPRALPRQSAKGPQPSSPSFGCLAAAHSPVSTSLCFTFNKPRAQDPSALVRRPCRRVFFGIRPPANPFRLGSAHAPSHTVNKPRAGPLRSRLAALPPRILRDSPAGESLPVLGVREGEFPLAPTATCFKSPK